MVGSSAHAQTLLQIDNPLPAADAQFGKFVAGLGDINGDGVPEIAIGAPGAKRVYVYSGATLTVLQVITDPEGDVGYRFGYSVRGIGDVDGDAVEDVAVGDPGPTLAGPCTQLPFPGNEPVPCPQFGRAFVFSGLTGNLLLSLLPDPDVSEDGAYLRFGNAVAPLGDINADGVPDIAVGAPGTDLSTNGTAYGEVYAFSGADGSQLWQALEPGSAPGQGQTFPSLGFFLAPLTDLDADGRHELLAPAHFADSDPDPEVTATTGKGYVLSGVDGAIWRSHNAAPSPGESFGAGPASIGHQDADFLEEYAFGDAEAGELRLFRGIDGSLLRLITSPAAPTVDRFGVSIATVDDKDADGLADFWVGAPSGETVYLMNRHGDLIQQVSDPNPLGTGTFLGFGHRVASTGDLNGDGSSDVLVGKPAASVAGSDAAGSAFVILLAPQEAILCPEGAGFWRFHEGEWPEESMQLGTETYDKSELTNLLGTPPKGDHTLILARQLITAKLNVSLGTKPGFIQEVIAKADNIFAAFPDRLPFPVKTAPIKDDQIIAVADLLGDYNRGFFSPGCAD